MKIHTLKTWNTFFKDVRIGRKTFEFRRNDRDFEVGDKLILKEYNYRYDEYSGHSLEVYISYIIDGTDIEGIEEGFCVLGIVK